MLLAHVVLFVVLVHSTLGQESPYSETVSRDRPVAYLRFDDAGDADRKVIHDSTGQHHGVLTGQLVPAACVPGTGGQAATFDGQTTVVTIPHSDSLTLDSLSVEFWFRTKQAFDNTFWPGSATLISKATPGGGTSDWTINAASTMPGEDQGRLLAQSGPQGKPSDLLLFSPVGRRLNDDRWHHVVWTRAAGGANRMYLDGELAAQGNDGGGKISNERSIQIGGDTVHEGARIFPDGSMRSRFTTNHCLSNASEPTTRRQRSRENCHRLRNGLSISSLTFSPSSVGAVLDVMDRATVRAA